MLISGFTFARNTETLGYPTVESIRSILPICDEFIIAIGRGDKRDTTREKVAAINDPKITIIDTEWTDLDSLKSRIYSQQTNLAASHCKGTWGFYLQCDEIIHEQYLTTIRKACEHFADNRYVDGFLFDYKHFWGDYDHYFTSHAWYPREIRIIRLGRDIISVGDAQSFRYGNGQKVPVVKIDAEVFHYGHVRDPRMVHIRRTSQNRIYKGTAAEEEKPARFDYGSLKSLSVYGGSYPAIMKERIAAMGWRDLLDYTGTSTIRHKHLRFKYRLLTFMEQKIFRGSGLEFWGYKPYRLLRSLSSRYRKLSSIDRNTTSDRMARHNSLKCFFEFGWKFFFQMVLHPFATGKHTDKYLFISQTGTEEWILGAKARRLSKHFPSSSEVLFSRRFKHLPDAPGYFFLNQKYFARALRYNPFLRRKKCIIMFTHPEWNRFFSREHAAYVLRKAHMVICLNRAMAAELVDIGLDRTRIEVCHIASEPRFFQPKEKRLGKTVGFCSAYYKRKNPELIYKIITAMPDTDFLLIGKNWQEYENFREMMEQPNFTYIENADYSEYPGLYRKMDVFCSPSFLEGGPVPLLEAMLSNIIPVASDTGFGPDIIQHGVNGFLFDPRTDSPETVMKYIRQALSMKCNVRDYVTDYSWETYGKTIYDLFLKP